MFLTIKCLFILSYLALLCHSDTSAYHRKKLRQPRQLGDNGPVLRRAFLSVAVLGDYVYVDGGLFSVDDAKPLPLNVTLSISLKESWSSHTLNIQEISKGRSPYLERPGLWVDQVNKSIYSWGGQGSNGNDTSIDQHHLWAFKPDGRGKGNWYINDPPDVSTFNQIYPGLHGLVTTCAGVGYSLGGHGSPTSDRHFKDAVPLNGLIAYNMTSRKWDNISSEALGYSTWAGSAACIESIGEAGLLIFLGGLKNNGLLATSSDRISFDNITIYEPTSKRWYWQKTTGDTPDSRGTFCSVGVPGPNGTYEIYIHGGWDYWARPEHAFGDTWVLSIPAFRWFKADAEVSKRGLHDCALIGNSQMISVGGNDRTEDLGWSKKDDWPQGVGVLDLPSMTWSNKYNADDSKYDSPKDVKDWYDNGDETEWNDEEVKSLFAAMKPQSSDTRDEESQSPEQRLPVGGIIGGVVGGVAVIIAAVGALNYIQRRRRREAPLVPADDGNIQRAWDKAELPAVESNKVEVVLVASEMDVNPSHAELPTEGTCYVNRNTTTSYELEG
ncbi:hypothetical protein NW768_002202 [Fusarium equiseti]|uniref:Kelch repeat protein n=1 Tax=Fusarium equiseti TaxID=61235 RepID=A0ABQ8RN92_FUSEQ|nr:hypothetical protein NW768_002202 [Fusarium equiseti]